ncbi:MAG: hypothetical protein ABIF01_02425 [Candidatus Micrarchaeota archaeon]
MIRLPFPKKDENSKGQKKPENQGAPPAQAQVKQGSSPKDPGHEPCRRREAALRKVIDRYRDHIEAGETKTVPDLKNLIDPKSKAVQEVKQKIEDSFHPYLYEANFEAAADKAFGFLRDDIGDEALPVDFWLSPDDVIELKLADEMDKAIFLCSLIIALDNETAKVVVETNGTRHAFVMFEFKEKFHLMDPVHNVNLSGSREEVVEKHLSGHEQKLVYEFNNKGYKEW